MASGSSPILIMDALADIALSCWMSDDNELSLAARFTYL